MSPRENCPRRQFFLARFVLPDIYPLVQIVPFSVICPYVFASICVAIVIYKLKTIMSKSQLRALLYILWAVWVYTSYYAGAAEGEYRESGKKGKKAWQFKF